MNPLVLLALVFALRSGGGGNGYLWQPPEFPTYFDTFRMELMLDRMRTLTEALDRVNHLHQLNQQAAGDRRSRTYGLGGIAGNGGDGSVSKAGTGLTGLLADLPGKLERISESLAVAKAFLADTKAERQVDQISGMVETLRQFGDPAALMEAAGPLLAGMMKNDAN